MKESEGNKVTTKLFNPFDYTTTIKTMLILFSINKCLVFFGFPIPETGSSGKKGRFGKLNPGRVGTKQVWSSPLKAFFDATSHPGGSH